MKSRALGLCGVVSYQVAFITFHPRKAQGWKSITATRYSSFLAPLDLEEMELLQENLVSGVKLSRAGYEKVIFKRQNSSLAPLADVSVL